MSYKRAIENIIKRSETLKEMPPQEKSKYRPTIETLKTLGEKCGFEYPNIYSSSDNTTKDPESQERDN